MAIQLSFKQETEDSVFMLKGLGVISISYFQIHRRVGKVEPPSSCMISISLKQKCTLLFCSWRIKMSVIWALCRWTFKSARETSAMPK